LLYFEDVHAADSWTSLARTITEADIVNFAGMTGDFDPLHVDREHASQSLYRRPIAHGLLGLAWVAGLASQCPRMATVAFVGIRNWEFHRPMYVGDTVRAVTRIAEKRPRSRRAGSVVWHRSLVNQEGATVQSGEFETLVALRVPELRRAAKDAVQSSVGPGITHPR